MNLAEADWTGLEQTSIYTSDTMYWQGGRIGATELRPEERTATKIAIPIECEWFLMTKPTEFNFHKISQTVAHRAHR